MPVLIANQQDRVGVEPEMERLLAAVGEKAMRVAGVPPEQELSVALVDDAAIRALNLRYRGLDCPTDVLSFPMGEAGMLGDVVISMERAREQAAALGHGLDREVAQLVAHGVLHLAGFDHDDEEGKAVMRAREDQTLLALGMEPVPWPGE